MKNALGAKVVVFGLILFSGFVSFAAEKVYDYVDDATITAKANEVIAKDPYASHSKIDVDSTGGNVVLMGSVNSKVTEERLISRIKLINGVKSVRSLLKAEEKK
jgi:osmotically-inducible protein OsmY